MIASITTLSSTKTSVKEIEVNVNELCGTAKAFKCEGIWHNDATRMDKNKNKAGLRRECQIHSNRSRS